METLGSVSQWKSSIPYPEPFLSWVKQYGGAVYFRELFSHVILLTDPKAIQHVLATNGANYPRDSTMEALFADMVFGVGLLSSNGALHDNYRKLLNPLFTSNHIKSFLDVFALQTQRCCDRLKTSTAPLDMALVFRELTLQIVGLSAFGFDFERYPHALAAYNDYQIELGAGFLIGMFMIPGFSKFPLPALIRRGKAHQVLKQVMLDVIRHKLDSNATETPQDLLDLILPHATTNEALVHTMTFVSAGHETTSSALSWVLAAIAANPSVAAQIRDEYRRVEASHDAAEGQCLLDPAELKYTLAVIQESLRLNSVVDTMVYRVAEHADALPMSDGPTISIPKGTSMMFCMAAMHRNPKFWTAADQFIPERFLEGSAAWQADALLRGGGKSHAYIYMPFSAGSKNCIGQRFAVTEMQIIIATLVGQLDFELTPQADLRHRHNGITVQPVRLQVKVEPAATT
ncbi:unnamed protein product [Aphanomyces euteiches]